MEKNLFCWLSLIGIIMFTSDVKAQNQKTGTYIEIHPQFLKKNPGVESFRWKTPDSLIVLLKSGLVETYDFRVEKERQTFNDQYGTPPPYVKKGKATGWVSRKRKTSITKPPASPPTQ